MNDIFAAHLMQFPGGPLIWLLLTLASYQIGRLIQKILRDAPLANPVLIAILIIVGLLAATGTPYPVYFSGAQFLHFLLGPATVALAIPLARNFARLRRELRGIGLALLAGSATSILSGFAIVRLLGGSPAVALSMAPKGATTPVAMAISQQVGGVASLTASLAILGGILAAAAGQGVLGALKIRSWPARGLAAGVAGSGIAASQIAAQNELGATYAAIGVGMNALLTALLVPALVAMWR